MRVLEVYADVCCPFTHVGLRRVVAARAERGLERDVRVRAAAWPLEWVNGHPLDPAVVASEVAALREQVAPDLFAGFAPERFPVTSLVALGIAAAAYEHEGIEAGERVSLALRTAVFEEGRDVADRAVAAEVAHRAGVAVPEEAAARALVEAEYAAGRARGATGSPFFVLPGGEGLFCPTLRITHEGERLRVEEDQVATTRLLDALLAS